MKQWLLQIFATKMGWLILSLSSTFIFGILTNWYEWANLPMLLSCIYPLGLTIVMLVYAWIINPIRNMKK